MSEYVNPKSCITSCVKEIINYSYAKGVHFLVGDGIFLLCTISILNTAQEFSVTPSSGVKWPVCEVGQSPSFIV
jgi:hypothetical protein